MIDDMLKLTVDKLFRKRKLNPGEKEYTYSVDGYDDTKNMWEFLFQLCTPH